MYACIYVVCYEKLNFYFIVKLSSNTNYTNKNKMSNNNRILKKQYFRFIDELQNKTIADYFGISAGNRKLSINVSRNANDKNKYMVEINCINPQQMFDFTSLPYEMNDEIYKFIEEYVKLTFCIEYPNEYPFVPPKWTLDKISYRVNTHVKLDEYYHTIADNHTKCYDFDWSPAIHLETDLVYFIQKINHFDMIFDCK